VNITAWNPLSSDNVQITIYVGNTIKGLMIDDGNRRVGKGEVYSLDISFEQTAPDMCVHVDFGDPETDSGDVFLYSNGSTCPQYPGVPIVGQVTNPMTTTYSYPNNGRYSVSVTAGNFLHTETEEIMPTISNANCKRPELSIYNQRPNIYDPAEMLRVDDIVKEGFAVFNCEVTLQNTKEWKVEKLNSSTGEVVETVDLQGDSITGASTATLYIISQALAYGLYGITFTVTMDPTEFPDGDIFSSSITTYLNVVRTPLQPALEIGRSEKITRGYGQELWLQPALYSKDPDLPEGEPQVRIKIC